jgi:hypothetical protein
MLPTPRTDQLVYPNGCLATSILEHARIPERETIQYEAELKRLIELSLELVWELQHLCKKPIHLKQEKELLALQEAK